MAAAKTKSRGPRITESFSNVKYRLQRRYEDGKLVGYNVIKNGVSSQTKRREWMETKKHDSLEDAQSYIASMMCGDLSSYWQ